MLDPEIAVQLRQRGWDVEAVTGDPELEGRKDPDLLRIASGQARILVADNVSDFTRLHRDFMAAGETHGGVLLASPAQFPRSKRTVGLWVTALDSLLGSQGEDVIWDNHCAWLIADPPTPGV